MQAQTDMPGSTLSPASEPAPIHERESNRRMRRAAASLNRKAKKTTKKQTKKPR